MVAERLFGMSSNPGSSLTIFSMGSLLEGFPKIRPGGTPGTNLGKRLLVPVEQ